MQADMATAVHVVTSAIWATQLEIPDIALAVQGKELTASAKAVAGCHPFAHIPQFRATL